MSHIESNHNMIKVSDLDKLHHMLGTGSRSPGFRNYYCAGDNDIPAMERLVMAGLVRSKSHKYYEATEQGCRVAGLSKAATKRAMEGIEPGDGREGD